MNQQQSVSILAQVSEGELTTDGLIGSGSQWVAIDNQFSLFGLAEDNSDETGKTAKLSLEILLDDIQTNLSSGEYTQATDYEKYVLATRCVEESFENINDYLISQRNSGTSALNKGVALTVMQVVHRQCSFILAEKHCCMLFREGKLRNLSQQTSVENHPETLLGVTESVPVKSHQLVLTANDLLLTCDRELLKYADEEYLRITLSRFQDSPQMAMRQITSKTQRSGMQGKPVLIMVSINQIVEKSKSWFKR